MTRIPPACTLSRQESRRHEPCSRQPCVLTVDFESELRLTWFCQLCFFNTFLFSKRLRKVVWKTNCPLGCRHIFVLPLLLCPLSLRPNMSSWLCLPASRRRMELLRLFNWDKSRTIQSVAERQKKSRKTETGRDIRQIDGLKFGQLLYRQGQRDFLDGGVLMARC